MRKMWSYGAPREYWKGGKGAKCCTNVCGDVFLPGFAATVLPGAYALVL